MLCTFFAKLFLLSFLCRGRKENKLFFVANYTIFRLMYANLCVKIIEIVLQ